MSGNGFHTPPPPLSGRDRWLLGLLNLSLAFGLIVFLIMSTQGWALWFFVIVGGLAMLGCVHYLLWGRALEQATQAERERWRRESSRPPQSASSPISSWTRRF